MSEAAYYPYISPHSGLRFSAWLVVPGVILLSWLLLPEWTVCVELYCVMLWTLVRLNRGAFAISPAGIFVAYFSLYVFFPALALYLMQSEEAVAKFKLLIDVRVIHLLMLACAGIALGAWLVGKDDGIFQKTRDNLSRFGARFPLQLFLLLAIGLTGIFVLTNLSGIVALALGAFSNHYAEVQQFKTEALYGSNWLLQGINQIIPIAGLCLLSHRYSSGKRAGWVAWLLGATIVLQFLTGGLWVGFSIVLMALLLKSYFLPETRQKIGKYALGLLGLVTIALGIKYGSGGQAGFIFDVFHRFTSGTRQLQWVIENQSGYEFGLSYVRDLIAMIPSPIKRHLFAEQWWGGFNGVMFQRMYGFYGGTAQVPLIGEFYVNGGPVWVFLGSILHGALIQKFSNLLRGHQLQTTFGAVCAVVIGYRLGECTVEGIGTRLFVSLLWLSIFYVAIMCGRAVERSLSPTAIPK